MTPTLTRYPPRLVWLAALATLGYPANWIDGISEVRKIQRLLNAVTSTTTPER